MTDDAELLRCFAEDSSEKSFALLVQRHIGFVFATALRRLNGNQALAEEVVQLVFIDLARKASRLPAGVVLIGWLFNSTRFAAKQIIRADRRRRIRERKAVEINELMQSDSTTVNWGELRPVLDDLIGELPERERHAVLLRFFDGCDFTKIGARLGTSPDGARTRVNRALERMNRKLARRGVSSTIAALSTGLASAATVAVPAELAATVAKTALVTAPAASGIGLLFLSMNKTIVGVTSALAVAATIGLVVQHKSNFQLRAQIERLRSQSKTEVNLRMRRERLANTLSNPSTNVGPTGVVTMQKGSLPATGGLPGAGMIARETWADVGLATPAAAYETALWAVREQDLDALAKTFVFRQDDREKLAALIATLPEDARAKYASPEQVMALMISTGPEVEAFQILSETQQGPNTVVAQVQLQLASGSSLEGPIVFQGGADGWQLLLPQGEVAGAIRFLTGGPAPSSGER